jgi:hypothetical protein
MPMPSKPPNGTNDIAKSLLSDPKAALTPITTNPKMMMPTMSPWTPPRTMRNTITRYPYYR